MEYGSSTYMKVIGSRSRSQEQKGHNAYSCIDQLPSAIFIVLVRWRRRRRLAGGQASY